MKLEKERGQLGNLFYRIGGWFKAQRSGHGAICDVQLGRLIIWCNPKTGRPFHWFISKENNT